MRMELWLTRGGAARQKRSQGSLARQACAADLFSCMDAGALPVPEGRRRKLAGGKPAAGAAPGSDGEMLRAPAGHRRNRPPTETLGGGSRGGGCVTPFFGRRAVRGTPRSKCPREISSMPRWGTSDSARSPGAASAGADLPPANVLRRPSGTRTQRHRSQYAPLQHHSHH